MPILIISFIFAVDNLFNNLKLIFMETNVFQVIKNGNVVVLTDCDRSIAYKKARSLAKNRTTYVELWFINENGSRLLLNYWN